MTDLLGEELLLLHAVADTQRALLTLQRRADARTALVTFVERLGGTVVPADPPVGDVLPIDLSLGTDEPVLPVAPAGTPLRSQLERTLPELVQHALYVTAVLDGIGASQRAGEVDHLTGAPKRRHLEVALERAVPGEDRLVGFVVGEGGWLIEPFGRMRSDGLVRSLAGLVRTLRHPTDPWGRLDGPGVAVLALRSDEERTRALVDDVLRRWPDERPLAVDLRVADIGVTEPAGASLDRLEEELDAASAGGATAAENGDVDEGACR